MSVKLLCLSGTVAPLRMHRDADIPNCRHSQLLPKVLYICCLADLKSNFQTLPLQELSSIRPTYHIAQRSWSKRPDRQRLQHNRQHCPKESETVTNITHNQYNDGSNIFAVSSLHVCLQSAIVTHGLHLHSTNSLNKDNHTGTSPVTEHLLH